MIMNRPAVVRVPTVPSIEQLRALNELMAWTKHEPPPTQVLRDFGADLRLMNALCRNDIFFLDQLYPLYDAVKTIFGERRVTEKGWLTHSCRIECCSLDGIGAKKANDIVTAYEAWAKAAPEDAALIVAFRDRPPRWRAQQVVRGFLCDGMSAADLAEVFGISSQGVHRAMDRAGLTPELRNLHRIERAWATMPCELADSGMGPCEGDVEAYVPTSGYGGEPVWRWCRRHGDIVESG